MSRSRVTIRDVAAAAGVSHQTVSRVINNIDRVSPETKIKVLEAIKNLGYQPNAIARSMARGRTCMLACVAPNLTDYTLARIIEGAEKEARKHDYFMLSTTAEDLESFQLLMQELVNSRRVEGLVVINPYADGRFAEVRPEFPVVFVGARPRGGEISSVALDDLDTGYQATRHLLDIGSSLVATITGPMSEDCSQDRLTGYQKALHENGLSFNSQLIWHGDWSATSGFESFHHFITLKPTPDAIFAQNDRMAIGVLRAAREMGVVVPDQLAVIGVDDMPLASYFDPPLTTMRQDTIDIGRQALKLLIRAVDCKLDHPEHILVPAELVVRKSTVTDRKVPEALSGGEV